MKKCIDCKKEYSKNNFYSFSSYCKKCHVNRNFKNRFLKFGTYNIRKTPYITKIRESDRVYQKEKRRKNPEQKKKETYLYNKRNPEKFLAQKLARKAIKIGKLKKTKCRDCPRKDVHAHHPNYKYPLKVIFLCPIHHKMEHYKSREYMKSKINS